jgi:hypothetical protein
MQITSGRDMAHSSRKILSLEWPREARYMVLGLRDALGILIAALGGAAVGLEREWSGHATGPRARFAGIRTFTLLGLLAGLEGWLWSNGPAATKVHGPSPRCAPVLRFAGPSQDFAAAAS